MGNGYHRDMLQQELIDCIIRLLARSRIAAGSTLLNRRYDVRVWCTKDLAGSPKVIVEPIGGIGIVFTPAEQEEGQFTLPGISDQGTGLLNVQFDLDTNLG